MSAGAQHAASSLHAVSRLYFPVGAQPAASGPYHPLAAGSAGGSTLFELDQERERYLSAKRALVQREGRAPVRMHEPAAVAAAALALALVREQLTAIDRTQFAPERIAELGLDALMLEVQEDLVIMHKAPGSAPERARAGYLHVCFPSDWAPSSLLAKNFLSLHARVPYEAGFERAERPRHAAALFSQPAVRFIWSLSPDALLDHHPETARPSDWHDAEQVFLRVERQVIVPLSADAALFIIRTYVYPTSRLTTAQRDAIVQALAVMPEALRRYKALWGHERRIGELLASAKD
jgi:Protein of unknown function (DUF3445)